MRTKSEIAKIVNESKSSSTTNNMTLEVLVDIRDLLQIIAFKN